MTYYQFVEAVENRVKGEVEKSVSVHSYTASKNNGTVRRGILLQKEGTNISPIIYLEEFFEQFKDGSTMEYIIEDILRLYREVSFQKPWKGKNIKTYEEIEDRIVYRLVNHKANEKMLEKMPYVPYLDLAVVFYVLLEAGRFGTASMAVCKEHLKLWGVSEEELYESAKENTRRLLPDDFCTMSAVIEELTMQEPEFPEGETEDVMYVLSNNIRSYGAAAILYPGRLEAIGAYLQSSYYVLPSSVHEVIIVPEKELSEKSMLSAIVREINETHVRAEDVLSDHAYYYDRRRNELKK